MRVATKVEAKRRSRTRSVGRSPVPNEMRSGFLGVVFGASVFYMRKMQDAGVIIITGECQLLTETACRLPLAE